MMQPRMCEREPDVLRAAQRAARQQPAVPSPGAAAYPALDPAVAEHLRTCAGCREAFEVARYMTRLAAETDAIAAARPLPEPAQLWWKARLLQRWDAATRASAPVDWMQRVEVVGGLVAVTVLLLIFWTDFRGGLAAAGHAGAAGSTVGAVLPAIASVLAPGALSSYIAGALLLVGCVSLFMLRQLLVED